MDAQWPGGHTPSDLSPAVGPSSQKLREADARPPHAFLGGLGSVSALLVLSERPDFPYLSKGAAGLLACGEGTPGSRAPPPQEPPKQVRVRSGFARLRAHGPRPCQPRLPCALAETCYSSASSQ